MLRASLVRQINETIESVSSFRANDLVVEEAVVANKRGGLSVRYRYEPRFLFQCVLPNIRDEGKSAPRSSVYSFLCVMVPGTLADSESRTLTDKGDRLATLTDWLGNVAEELRAVPLNRELAEQRQQIDAIMAELGELPGDYLSKEEAVTLAVKLGELEARLAETLRAQGDSEEKLKARIAALHRDMETLKEQLHSLPKKGWVGSFTVRMKKWVTDPDNQTLLRSGMEMARLLLPPGGG